ncbi:hypothetical protein M378DRAFT_83314 [Amanita muscaria Koide BX008]|uniref:Amino acid transporter transmembrane domain-containing protein n=1 Tax=Amanita muscaria (strain Koide BX008) TaxID=946122 RepID=A0A0C2T2T5_AMAMK|nr:hypothetical protein M378DRAFT_83314 [Amanita muscaria Koide BX008]
MDFKITQEAALADHSHFEPQPKAAFEDYLFYAQLQRREEETASRISTSEDEKTEQPVAHPPMTPEQTERASASRALRLTSWISVFYLITTDILGPFNAPYAISQTGWIPGVLLYFFMGVAATYSGLILWQLFLKLDSVRYPLRTYPDIAGRIFGKAAQHICTFLQSLQLLMNVAVICLSNGQSLAQVVQNRLCFSVCIVIFPIIGMMIGQIRSLKNFSWLANSAVWINLAIIFISMGFVAHSPPNFAAAASSLGVEAGPVVTAKYVSLPLYNQINGVMQMVFAYGGAMIFPEIMAEMRRPMDFWKGFSIAQLLIFFAYLLYGCFIYAYQGQFTLPAAYQGVSTYSWQTVGNVLGIVTGLIAAGLYGNIGIKTVYINIVEELFKGPRLMSSKGRTVWFILVLFYWSFAFVVGSAIPQLGNIVGLIGAVAIMQFTYTFPPLLWVGYEVIIDAMKEDGPYVPGSGANGRIDTWRDWSRWKRGLFTGRWHLKLFNVVIGLGGLATACLGMWGSGEAIKAGFEFAGAATSFGCKAPV